MGQTRREKEKMLLFVILSLNTTNVIVTNAENNNSTDKRQLSFLNVVKFPDDECDADSGRKGTCLSKEACEDKGGTGSGDCANGYGVCCIIQLGCGDTSSNNITYFTYSTSSPDRTCNFYVCKAKDDICRIKFEFTTFDIAPAETGTAATSARPTTNGGTIGQCITDSFALASAGNGGSPVICGFNTGQH